MCIQRQEKRVGVKNCVHIIKTAVLLKLFLHFLFNHQIFNFFMIKYFGVYSTISVPLVNCANLRPKLNPASNNLFKVTNRNTSRKIEISFKISQHCSDVNMLTFNILCNFTTPSLFYCDPCTGKQQVESCSKKYTKSLIHQIFSKFQYLLQ